MNRNPELSRRRAQAFDKQRFLQSTEECVQQYFSIPETAFKKCKELSNGVALESNRIYAADEVGFTSDKLNSMLFHPKVKSIPLWLIQAI